MKVGVVADDITGSNDIGSMFASGGYLTHVYTSDTFDPAELGRPHPDVCIVDTNSRLDPPRFAYDKVYAATRQLQEAGCEHFFNKTCSVFRGNIGPELDAMLDALGETLAIVVLGFPKNGRVTRDGVHYVHGLRLEDSHFRHDPIHPATASNLVELLQSQTERTCGLVTHEVVSAGVAVVQARLAQLRERCQYIIFDVLDQAALATIARATGDYRVFAGSSALAEELPVVWGGGRDYADSGILPPRDGKGALCVAGSLTPQTKAQIEFLQAQGLAVVELDTLRIFDPAGRTEEIERIVAPLVDHLTAGRHTVVHAANQPSIVERTQTEGERRGLHRAEVGRLVGETLAEIVVRTSRYTGLRRMVIAGGETSEAICRRLGIHGMRVWKEIQPGVPSCVSLQDRPLLLVLKSGSFGTPDFLEEALAHVQAQQQGDHAMTVLTQEQLAHYHEQGYVLVEGVLSRAEAQALREEAHALIERLSAHRNVDATWGSARGIMEQAQQTQLLHCHDTQFYSAAFSRLIVDERITGIAAEIIGSPNVQLHHNKLFIKPPEKGSPFPMHQDYPFFPHDRHTMIAAIIHFDDAPIEKGCVRVVPGSHREGPLEHQPEGGHHLPFEQYPVESAVPCPAKAGDVLFFSYLTVHGSGINSSDEARTTLLVQMRDPADPPTVKTHESRGQGMMLRGIDPTAGPPR